MTDDYMPRIDNYLSVHCSTKIFFYRGLDNLADQNHLVVLRRMETTTCSGAPSKSLCIHTYGLDYRLCGDQCAGQDK